MREIEMTMWTRILMGVVVLACVSMRGGAGVITFHDGSFSYQGYMEVDGEAANGAYSFRVVAFQSADGSSVASELFYISPLVNVVNGLFVMQVQMGGTPEDARDFWKAVGNQDLYLEIGVSEIEGGNYETLGTRVRMGSGARAQYSVFSEALTFPYSDNYTDPKFDPTTMISLTSVAGGSVLEAIAGTNSSAAIIAVNSATPDGSDFGPQTGGVHIDANGRTIGLVSIANGFGVAGLIFDNSGSQQAGVLGQISDGVPNAIGVQALNFNSGTQANLATETYAGDFDGDVLMRDDLRVRGEATRDFATNSPSPIGPLAYGVISAGGTVSSGTANLSATWNSALLRYDVSVDGENIHFATHTVVISVVDISEPHLATYNSAGGNVLVKIWDLNSGNIAIQDNFSIVIYNANPVVVSAVEMPEGVDLDKYTESTGAVLIETRPAHEPIDENSAKGVGE